MSEWSEKQIEQHLRNCEDAAKWSRESDVVESLLEWTARFVQRPASPESPTGYERDFLIRVAEEVKSLRVEVARLRGLLARLLSTFDGPTRADEYSRVFAEARAAAEEGRSG